MRPWPALALSCTLAACRFDLPAGARADAPGGGDGPGGCTSFSTQLDTCALPGPFPLTLSGLLTFNTDTGVLRDAGNLETPVVSVPAMTRGAEVRAIVATTVMLMPNTILRATGVRGLAIVANGAVTLQANAVVDVSRGGAGHLSDCGGASATPGADDASGAAGGGGGGFGAVGGAGGNGDADTGQSLGGAGGAAVPTPAGPLGGCPGANGGRATGTTNDGGAGGAGGGAIYLVSAVSIAIAAGGGIHAGGGGGGGGECEAGFGDAGGGGGGSGGSIFLEAPVIRSYGVLAANGGGGGEGSGNSTPGVAGSPGQLGLAAAAGGQGGSATGADGGAGGTFASPAGAQPAQVLNGGGGGGGGGVGFIRVNSPDAQLGAVSPPAT